MIFHIAICSPDGALRSRLEHQCMEFFARREDACIVEQLQSPEALLQQDAAGLRYELYLIELAAVARPEGLTAAAELRRRGRRAPLAFVARTPAHAYSAYRVDAMQYLLQPVHQPEVSALLKRAVEPEYGPTLTVTTADGVRALAYAEIEYLECTHHIVHFHLTTGEDVDSISLCPFLRWRSRCLRTAASCSRTAPMWSIWRRCSCWHPARYGCAAGRASPSPADGKPPSGRPSAPG